MAGPWPHCSFLIPVALRSASILARCLHSTAMFCAKHHVRHALLTAREFCFIWLLWRGPQPKLTLANFIAFEAREPQQLQCSLPDFCSHTPAPLMVVLPSLQASMSPARTWRQQRWCRRPHPCAPRAQGALRLQQAPRMTLAARALLPATPSPHPAHNPAPRTTMASHAHAAEPPAGAFINAVCERPGLRSCAANHTGK